MKILADILDLYIKADAQNCALRLLGQMFSNLPKKKAEDDPNFSIYAEFRELIDNFDKKEGLSRKNSPNKNSPQSKTQNKID